MRDRPTSVSPLGSVRGAPAAAREHQDLTFAERPFLAKLCLRGDPRNEAFDAAVQDALGLPLPPRVNASTAAGERALLCLGPDEWLFIAPEQPGPEMLRALHARLSLAGGYAIDVGSASTCLRISGPQSAALIRKGCSVSPDGLGAGDCARTKLARFAVLIHRPAVQPLFDLYVARSYARSLCDWLNDAAAEFESMTASASA